MKKTKKFKVKRSEAKQVVETLKPLFNVPGKNLSYILDRNIDKLNSVDKALSNKYNKVFSIKGYKEYDEKRLEVCKSYSDKNEKGEIKRNANGSFVIAPENMDKFFENIELIQKDFPEVKKHLDSFEKYAQQEVVIDVFTIDESQLPDINYNQRQLLKFMINDDFMKVVK